MLKFGGGNTGSTSSWELICSRAWFQPLATTSYGRAPSPWPPCWPAAVYDRWPCIMGVGAAMADDRQESCKPSGTSRCGVRAGLGAGGLCRPWSACAWVLASEARTADNGGEEEEGTPACGVDRGGWGNKPRGQIRTAVHMSSRKTRLEAGRLHRECDPNPQKIRTARADVGWASWSGGSLRYGGSRVQALTGRFCHGRRFHKRPRCLGWSPSVSESYKLPKQSPRHLMVKKIMVVGTAHTAAGWFGGCPPPQPRSPPLLSHTRRGALTPPTWHTPSRHVECRYDSGFQGYGLARVTSPL